MLLRKFLLPVSRWSLFRQPLYESQAYPVLEALLTLFFAACCVTVASVFSAIQWHNRPLTLHTIVVSNDTLVSSLPSAGYTCDCSLPAYLEGLKSVEALKRSTQLRRCYRKDALQTVTVVQFSNHTLPHLPALVLDTIVPESPSPSFKTFNNGFSVTQVPQELELWHGDPENILFGRILSMPLLQGTGVLRLPLKGMLDALYFDFPRGYMRMQFRYWCSNCSYCGIDVILNLPGFQGMDVSAWAACSGWGSAWNNCGIPSMAEKGYEGRCIVYPTYDVPMAARLKQFLTTFDTMPYIVFITGTAETDPGLINLYLYLLYMNISHFASQVPITYGFMEVDKGGSAWLRLSQQFPGVKNECKEQAHVEICEGTSFCGAFKTSADLGSSSISLNCTDFRDEYTSCLRLANTSGNDYRRDTLCPRNFSCTKVPQYSVVYNLEGESFDNRLFSGKMEETFMSTYAGGVCSNTYENVVRHGDELWVTECTDVGLCHLTGLYHNLNDPSWEKPKSSPHLLNHTTPLYTCYTPRKQKLSSWVIVNVGAMFAWFSSLLLGIRYLYVIMAFFSKRTTSWLKNDINEAEAGSRKSEIDLVPCVKGLEEKPLFPA